jgi:UDP-N-acetylmuramoyl-tripeptide--D-alanyl-D-alanine ligase
LGRLAVRLGVSRVVAVGPGAQPIHNGARDEGPSGSNSAIGEGSTWVPDADAAHELLRQHLAPGDVVLVKSSRDAGLRWLGDRLVQDTGSEVSS